MAGDNREWKRGYVAARNYTRQHPEKPVDPFDITPDEFRTSFDDGWRAGTQAELDRQSKKGGAS